MTEAKKEALGLRLWRLFLRALPLIGLTALGLWLWLSGEKPSVDMIKEAVRTYTDDKPLMVALFLLLLFALKSVSLMFPILVLMAACGALFPLPAAILIATLGTALTLSIPYFIGRGAGPDMTVKLQEKHVAGVLTLAAAADPHGRLDLPKGLSARRHRERLEIRRTAAGNAPVPFSPVELEFGKWTRLNEPYVDVFWGPEPETAKIHGKFTTFFFKKSQICGRILVRPRMAGDHLRMAGRCGKSLKKWMTELKIPPESRYSVPVFSDEKGVLAVLGIGQDVRAAASPQTADAVLVISERT